MGFTNIGENFKAHNKKHDTAQMLCSCSLAKSHGQRSLVGYSPWGHKESDTTEQLQLHFREIRQ